MTDKASSSPVVAASGETPASPVAASKKTAKTGKRRAKPAHPKTADMVTAAIVALQERGGSSLVAIKKYMAGTYKIDTEKQATFIKKYLKAAVASDALIQTKGKGATGSFKLAKSTTVKPKAKTAAPKTAAPKKVPAAKKPVATKKTATPVKKASTRKPAPSSPVAPKKKAASKGPAAKPPKPKTTKAKPAAKAPAKKSKPTAAKKTRPVTAKAKKVATKKTAAPKK